MVNYSLRSFDVVVKIRWQSRWTTMNEKKNNKSHELAKYCLNDAVYMSLDFLHNNQSTSGVT